MSCPYVSGFFSCSFKEDDSNLNDFFKSLCGALNITCKNVSDGYTSTPPEVARRLIEESKVVIAIIPKRDQTTTGDWTMPSAAHEEIAMAYALKKPTLIIVENNVKIDGFFANFGTYISFERSKIYTNEFISKAVLSLHNLRLEAVEQNNMLPEQDAVGYYADSVDLLVDLIKIKDQPVWQYSCTRKLIFTKPFSGPFITKAWADFVPDAAEEKIDHDIICNSNRPDIKHILQTIRDTPQQLEIAIDFEPKPQKDDWVEVEFSYSSPHLNPLSRKDLTKDKLTTINGRVFECFDGVIPIVATRELHAQFRFPSWYPIDRTSIYPFVGSYSSGVDYIVDSEIKRCQISIKKFGSVTQIDICVESPLLRHVYGIAWNFSNTPSVQ